MSSPPSPSPELGREVPEGPHLTADEFYDRFFGPAHEPTRKQPWREQIQIKEQHYIHIINGNLRLWGKHVAAHS